ncbi:hypothetical protein WJX81_005374 [Elliptochloris bilobata]|uniref:AB hydrolase-1 domain-containing protein n=1 Tax=Elliptochloris bilobata TaxID=381761 RepID=A0AAW1QKJ0_9CHLO
MIGLDAEGPPRLQLLLLPGNPGFAHFYAPFLCALHAALGGGAAVACASYLGHHCRTSRPCGRIYGLEEQMANVAALLRALQARGAPVAIVGHSLGAYLALHATQEVERCGPAAAKRLTGSCAAEPLHVSKVVALFPFMAVDRASLVQRVLAAAARVPWLMAALGALLGRLPARFVRWVARRVAGADAHAEAAVQRCLRGPAFRNFFALARDEFAAMARPDWRPLARLGPRATVLCSAHDCWFPDWQAEQVARCAPQCQVIALEGKRHDFCVSVEQSQQVAERTAALLRPLLLEG